MKNDARKAAGVAKRLSKSKAVQDINLVGGFIDFLRSNAVVGLAVGFAIGSQAQTLVKQLVNSFITPIIDLLIGKSLVGETFKLTWHGRSESFAWGALIYAMLDFFFLMITIYVIIKVFSLDKLDKPKDTK